MKSIKKLGFIKLFLAVLLTIVLDKILILFSLAFWKIDISDYSVGNNQIRLFCEFILTGAIVWLIFSKERRAVLSKLFHARYVIALFVLLFSVFFELSGSSIGMYSAYLGTDNSGIVFGRQRDIRSDEFAVFTPMAFSQEYNDYEYYGDIFRGESTDMFIEYGQPVRNIAILFRPFQIGYLLLGSSRGLSFFWTARLLVLFLVTIETGMNLSKGSKKLSLLAATLVTFAPVVQWWFSINGLVEMLIFGQIMALSLKGFLISEKKIIYTTLFFWAAGCYLFTMYPAWEIALAYIFGFYMLGIIILYRKECTIKLRDIGGIVLNAAIWGGLSGYIIVKSWDAIKALVSTVYPGKRVETGGGGLQQIFQSFGNLFFGTLDNGFYTISDGNLSNVCQNSVFIDLFPLVLFLAIWVIVHQRKKDPVLLLLLTGDLFLGLYVIIGFPSFLAKITLLSYCPTSRVVAVWGLLNIFIMIRSLALNEWKIKGIFCLIISFAYGLLNVVVCESVYGQYMTPIKTVVTAILVIALSIGFLQFNYSKKNHALFCICFSGLIFFCGIIINPIQRGTDVITESDLINNIAQIVEEDKDGLWIVEGGNLVTDNLPTVAGAKTINSTNVYPDVEKWKKLVNADETEQICNRYAHIMIALQNDEDTFFELNGNDSFTVHLNAKDLEKLNVTYIMTNNDLSWMDEAGMDLTQVSGGNGYQILKINY